MPNRFCDEIPLQSWPSISLEDGADESPLNPETLQLTDQGLTFEARWEFPVGTQLSVTIPAEVAGSSTARRNAEGIVIDCQEVRTGWFQTLVYFLEHEALFPTPGGL